MVLVLGGLGILGCSSPSDPARGAGTVGIVLRLPDGAAPSPQQAALADQQLSGVIARAGLRKVSSAREADFVLTATFLPEDDDPAQGRTVINRFVARARMEGRDDPVLREMQQGLKDLENWSASQTQTHLPR